MSTFITGRKRSRVRWVPSRLGSQYAGSHGSKKYSSDLSGSTDFHGVRGTRANIAVPDRSIRLRGSARLDAGRILLTWGICTRRAGKRYRAHSRLYRSQILRVDTHLKALAEIYTIHYFAQLCNLNFLSKNRFLQNVATSANAT